MEATLRTVDVESGDAEGHLGMEDDTAHRCEKQWFSNDARDVTTDTRTRLRQGLRVERQQMDFGYEFLMAMTIKFCMHVLLHILGISQEGSIS